MSSMIALARSSCVERLLVFAVCVLPPLFGAKSNVQPASGYLCDVYGAAEGLPENTVASLARTTDGYLWVATQGKGLSVERTHHRKGAAVHVRPLLRERQRRSWQGHRDL